MSSGKLAFRKILIANRGEIAVRIMATARMLGMKTVAVYSTADAGALHVAQADEAVAIGEAAASKSYLDIAAIIGAAQRSGADAIHPGYGFLSENAAFARACHDASITFIGPPADAIELMGNKRGAKEAMQRAGVPVVPGYAGPMDDPGAVARAAAEIGYPVMVKAAAGGGGRGMRLVATPDELAGAVASAASEAQNAFGSGELILEKALVRPRHVEVQVFADAHGHAIHLGERDCSVQRRHQKVFEESPSPAVNEALRREMGSAAVGAAKACGYVGAGTVELLLCDGRFYFLEMNTRLQVEHPVTELVTGIDLVAWQIRIAAGEALPLTQEQVKLDGHAIEARLYAEDPARDYMPQTGRILRWSLPAGVRVDHGIREGATIGAHYDAMLAKVIAHGRDRHEAVRRLESALAEITLLGVVSNKALLQEVCDHPVFASGEATTAFLTEDFGAPASLPEPRSWALAALAAYLHSARPLVGAALDLVGWRSGGPIWSALRLAHGSDEVIIRVERTRDRVFALAHDGDDWRVDLEVSEVDDSGMVVIADGVRRRIEVAIDGTDVWIDDGRSWRFENVSQRAAGTASEVGSGRLVAPLDGAVTKVLVAAGERVEGGQLLMVVEAMKMEHLIRADIAGQLDGIHVSVGDQVKARQLLAEIQA